MNQKEYLTLEIGDIVEGHGWRGQYIKGTVISMTTRRATIREPGTMMTVSYKKLTLVQHDPTSKIRLRLMEFKEPLARLMELMEE